MAWRGSMRLAMTAALAAVTWAGCGDDPAAPRRLELVTAEQPGSLLSVWIAPDGVAYAAGGVDGGGDGLLLRWRGPGHDVEVVPTPGAHAFWWIHGFAADDMWLAGESGEAHRFDGIAVTRVDAGMSEPLPTLFGIWGNTSDDLWVVGGSFVAGGARRVILRRQAGVFRPVASPASVDDAVTYFKVWGSGASDVWIAGDLGVILRWDGTQLTRAEAPRVERYLTVHGCGPRDVYAVGGGASGAAVHFDGSSFLPLRLGNVPPLGGVACDPGGGGVTYVGGFFGYAARVSSGGNGAGETVTVLDTPEEIAGLAIHGMAAAAGRVLAVGGDLTATGLDPRRGFLLAAPAQ